MRFVVCALFLALVFTDKPVFAQDAQAVQQASELHAERVNRFET